MRARTIKPSIVTNEDLHELGPFAYILFTGLWMLADREGRLEDRPKRIQALVLPLWNINELSCGKLSKSTLAALGVESQPGINELSCGNPVENLLQGLAEKGFIRRYQYAESAYLQIVNWHKHQKVHPREAPSVIPPEALNSNSSARSRAKSKDMPRQDPSSAKDMPSQPLPSSPSFPSFPSLPPSAVTRVREDAPASPPLSKPDPNTDAEPDPEPDPPPPAKHRPREAERKPPSRSTSETNGATSETKRATSETISWWPYRDDDVQIVRQSLGELAQIARLPAADDRIILRVLDAARGAPGADISRVLRELYLRRKFQSMYSWGLVPVMVADWFRAAA